jgi:predicted TIM-barrel fold metal-dependent hydrolase
MGGLQDVENYVSGKGNIRDNWFYIILQMIEEFPNLYTDISYSMYNKRYWNALKLVLNNPYLKSRVLFGTDWYVLLSDGKEEDFLALKEYLSDDEFKLITDQNPKGFFSKEIVF